MQWCEQWRQRLHWLKDVVWYGSACRCGLWLQVTRVPTDPLLAALLPWAKPFSWYWAREQVTELLIEHWPGSALSSDPETNTAMLTICQSQAARLLESSLAAGYLAVVRRA